MGKLAIVEAEIFNVQAPVSEMTYTVSSGTLNSSISYSVQASKW